MSNTVFYPLAANGADYPRPLVPLLPQPSWAAWCARSGPQMGSPFLSGGESFTHSRYALAEAMRRAGVGRGGAVLVPAFHCRTMVEPALYLDAEVFYYPVTPDLRPNFEAVTDRMKRGAKVVAMLLTHYFGFPNAVEESDQFCKARGIVLIEDCAHALYGQVGDRHLGKIGSYAAASLWKFLPVRDGSVLLDNTGDRSGRRAPSRSIVAELKAVARLTESWVKGEHQRLFPPAVTVIDVEARRILARGPFATPEDGLKEFSPASARLPALASSRWLSASAAHGRVAQKRRENYQRWLLGVHSIPGITPLFPELPAHVVPYAFPLLIDAEGLLFHALKLAGIPIWRWEDMAITDCSVAQDYRLRLLQLPCHQELSEQELEWLIQTVRDLAREVLK